MPEVSRPAHISGRAAFFRAGYGDFAEERAVGGDFELVHNRLSWETGKGCGALGVFRRPFGGRGGHGNGKRVQLVGSQLLGQPVFNQAVAGEAGFAFK